MHKPSKQEQVQRRVEMGTQVLPSSSEDAPGDDQWEIERKFLVPVLPEDEIRDAPASIRQGYLVVDTDGSSVRLRQIGDRFVQTIKQGKGVQRREVEIDINANYLRIFVVYQGAAGTSLIPNPVDHPCCRSTRQHSMGLAIMAQD